MPWFWKPYTSDVTSFIEQMKRSRPALEDEQRRGRERLWDRHLDLVEEAELDQARVAQQPYVYQTRVR
ncbi:MAG: DUF3460 family protein [Pseudomonadota bacterium]|nr:DUF3460 family protein [Pseudomonadota bacterium]